MLTGARLSLLRYGSAIIMVAVALVFTLLVEPIATRTPFALFFAAVMICSWYGGRTVGVLTIALSTVVSDYLVIPPVYSFAPTSTSVMQLTTFIVVALLINWLTAARQESERSLRESEARLNAVVENLAEGLVISDLDGQLPHWNRAALKLHGFASLEECLVKLPEFENIFELSTADGSVLRLEQWPLPRIIRGEHLRDLELCVRRIGTEWERIFVYGGSIIREPNGKQVAFMTITDVTERKHAERSLQEQARMLDLAPVMIRDLEGRIISWNSGVKAMFGWKTHEALGKISFELLQTEFPRPLEEIKATLFARGHWEGELVQTRKDGERIVVASQWVLHRDEHGKPKAVLVVNNDITERRRAEREIRRLNEELEQRVAERTAQLKAANKELEAFSYSVSHDLRAPLRHINGFSQALMEDYSDRLDDGGREYLREVRSASQEMAKLIDDLLQLARITRGEMHREEVNLSELAHSVIEELRKTNGKRNVTIEIGKGLKTRGDKRLLRVMLTNLLGNAWKFTSYRKQAEVSFGQANENGECIYFVRDNGAGFDMTYANKLFGAFQRLHTAGEFEGTGIGLATVQRIISRHGGRVWAEGVVDEGATFYFTLPNSKETGDERQSDSAG